MIFTIFLLINLPLLNCLEQEIGDLAFQNLKVFKERVLNCNPSIKDEVNLLVWDQFGQVQQVINEMNNQRSNQKVQQAPEVVIISPDIGERDIHKPGGQ